MSITFLKIKRMIINIIKKKIKRDKENGKNVMVIEFSQIICPLQKGESFKDKI